MEGIIEEIVRDNRKAHEDVAAAFLRNYGRWPKYTWNVHSPLTRVEEGSTVLTLTVKAGDTAPPGSVPMCWDVLNKQQISE